MAHRLDPDPGHAVETADSEVRKLAERRGREVEVGDLAACATIGDSDRHALALVCSARQYQPSSRIWESTYRSP